MVSARGRLCCECGVRPATHGPLCRGCSAAEAREAQGALFDLDGPTPPDPTAKRRAVIQRKLAELDGHNPRESEFTMSDDVVITPRDQQRVGAALTAYHRSDWRGVADVMRDATEDHRGFQFHVAVLRSLALLMGLHGPNADEVLADLQQQLLVLAGLAEGDGDAPSS